MRHPLVQTKSWRFALLAPWILLSTEPTPAGEADVLAATAECTSESICRFSVSVQHADEDWKHYANRWQILTPDGEVLATRILRHPHVGEQPFTRGLGGVRVPPHLKQVRIRAGDSVHDLGGAEITTLLERDGKREPQPIELEDLER